MAEKKKGAPELTEAQREKARAQMLKQKEKAAKKVKRQEAKATKGRPTVIIANTVKGCGSPVMENKAGWHHHVPTQEEYEQIMADFAARKEAALHE